VASRTPAERTVAHGGETWPIGSTQNIRGPRTGSPGTSRGVPQRPVVLDADRRQHPNDGVHPWKVTAAPATAQGRIRVTSVTDPTVKDVSDAVFAIQ
jgi:hypothetical protein